MGGRFFSKIEERQVAGEWEGGVGLFFVFFVCGRMEGILKSFYFDNGNWHTRLGGGGR